MVVMQTNTLVTDNVEVDPLVGQYLVCVPPCSLVTILESGGENREQMRFRFLCLCLLSINRH